MEGKVLLGRSHVACFRHICDVQRSLLHMLGCVQRGRILLSVLPWTLLLLALAIRYRDPGQCIRCHFVLLNTAPVTKAQINLRKELVIVTCIQLLTNRELSVQIVRMYKLALTIIHQ